MLQRMEERYNCSPSYVSLHGLLEASLLRAQGFRKLTRLMPTTALSAKKEVHTHDNSFPEGQWRWCLCLQLGLRQGSLEEAYVAVS